MDIPAKVTFRYLPDMDMSSDESDSITDTYKKSLDFSAHLIRTLKEQDPQADIVPFSPRESGSLLLWTILLHLKKILPF